MSDLRLEKLAELLVNYSIAVQSGDWVVVNGHLQAMPLIEEVVRHIYQAGGLPNLELFNDNIHDIRFREAKDGQLQWISPFETLVAETVDAYIYIFAADNTRALTSVDPERQSISRRARAHLSKVWSQRMADGSLRGVGTQFPCPALAQEAEMSIREFEDFVYAATFADQPDPVACWQQVHDEQALLVDWLAGKKEIVVRGPNVDLSLSIEGRGFVNSDGRRNMPSGEIFTSPVEDSANGRVRSTYPAIAGGREVAGVELTFENGRVVKATAAKNEEYLLRGLDMDEGARCMGEWAIGTNYAIQRFTKSILFDEKIGGTMHIAVGRGFPEIGGKNESALHWDFICDMREDSEILVDGELFYKNGRFQI